MKTTKLSSKCAYYVGLAPGAWNPSDQVPSSLRRARDLWERRGYLKVRSCALSVGTVLFLRGWTSKFWKCFIFTNVGNFLHNTHPNWTQSRFRLKVTLLGKRACAQSYLRSSVYSVQIDRALCTSGAYLPYLGHMYPIWVLTIGMVRLFPLTLIAWVFTPLPLQRYVFLVRTSTHTRNNFINLVQ